MLFTAYGAYFATTCAIFVKDPGQVAKGTTPQQATSMFSGAFATIYLLCEVLFKVLATIIPRNFSGGRSVVLFTYSVIAVVAAICMTVIAPLETPPADTEEALAAAQAGLRSTMRPADAPDAKPAGAGGKKLFAALSLFGKDKKMPLMIGLNLAFGFASAYLTSYLNGTVVRRTKGWEMIGYYSAITPVVAGALGMPLGWLGKSHGKSPVMMLGSVAFILMLLPAVGPTKLPLEVISQTPILIGVYMLEGTARCVFEGANRAVFADFFFDQKEAAFANIVWQSGGASTIAFLFMSKIDPEVIAYLGMLFAVFSIPGYWAAKKVGLTTALSHAAARLVLSALCSLLSALCSSAPRLFGSSARCFLLSVQRPCC